MQILLFKYFTIPQYHVISYRNCYQGFLAKMSTIVVQYLMCRIESRPRIDRTDKCFVSFSTCNPNTCSHWLTQSQKEADIYYLFIIG